MPILDPLQIKSVSLDELMKTAFELKIKHRGVSFSLCTIMNSRSGLCEEDCVFCSQSARYKTSSPVYGLKSKEEALKQARAAEEAGATRFSIVTSGRGPDWESLEKIAQMASEIREKTSISVCCSLGIADGKMLEYLKDAGVGRYHHNLESSREFFPKVCSTHGFEDRVNTIKAALDVGLEVCSGGIIGLGEDEEDRISLAMTLSELGVVSVPVNILVPHAGTPMEHTSSLSVESILRAIAIFRIMLPKAAIRLAGGRESALNDFLGLACMAGADGMLTGGYLTVKGRESSVDRAFVEQMKALWKTVC